MRVRGHRRRHTPSGVMALAVAPALCGWMLTASPVAAQHGIYLDLHKKDVADVSKHVQHPHVDGVLLRFKWAELEPRRGQFQLDLIYKSIAPWIAANKKVIIGVMPTAQREGYTPGWVFDAVPSVRFQRSPRKKPVTQIESWHPNFLRLEAGLIAELGKRFDRDARIEAVMVGTGHLGFITAAPSRAGAAAFVDRGWTPEKWTQYVLATAAAYREAFPTKTLYMRGSSLLLRMPNPARAGFAGHRPHLIDVRDHILALAATEHGISIGANGLSADSEAFLRSGLPDLFAQLGKGAVKGRYRLEVSDDWPLWVPPHKRHGINAGKDNAYFKRSLENAIGGVRGIPTTNISFMKMLADDLNCTNPNSPHYQPDCEEKLVWFKSRLRS